MKIVTLCLLISDGQILLGMKKKNFGTGKWNGFGGKVEEGETVEEATIREMEEESGISVSPDALAKVAVFDFEWPENPEWNQRMHVFLAREGKGEPRESDEMSPAWHSLDALPYKDMWSDDELWLPRVLRGELMRGNFVLQGDAVSSSALTLVSHSDELL